jgi:hypothetical protein
VGASKPLRTAQLFQRVLDTGSRLLTGGPLQCSRIVTDENRLISILAKQADDRFNLGSIGDGEVQTQKTKQVCERLSSTSTCK